MYSNTTLWPIIIMHGSRMDAHTSLGIINYIDFDLSSARIKCSRNNNREDSLKLNDACNLIISHNFQIIDKYTLERAEVHYTG